MIEYRKGNLLDVESGIIAHGCNCQGVMGSGVAKVVREKYPSAYSYYKHIEALRGLVLGEIQVVKVRHNIIVANLLTQELYGKDGCKYVSYDAIDQAFGSLDARNISENVINIPYIGAGLGGGDWSVISAIIESRVKTPVICWEL